MEEPWPAHAKAESPTPENHDYEYDEAHDVWWRPESGVNRPAEVLASVSDATRWR